MKSSKMFLTLSRLFLHVEYFGLINGIKLIFYKQFKREKKVSFNPVRFENTILLRTGTSDFRLYHDIFFNSQYNISLQENPKVIVDAGANIGLSVLFFAHKYPNAKIIAIEPESSNFDLLKHNTRNYPNIICLKKGLWYKKCFLKIDDTSIDKWAFTLTEVEENEGKDLIDAISLDDIFLMYGLSKIDLIKIDVEGSEKEIFEHISVDTLSKINAVIIETHDRMKDFTTKAVFTALAPFNYNVSISGDSMFIKL